MATSASPLQSAHASHLAQVFAQYPIEIAHGDGVWLHARDGRKILDFYGGHAVAGLGYGHPRWFAALERQARRQALEKEAAHMSLNDSNDEVWSRMSPQIDAAQLRTQRSAGRMQRQA